MRAHRLLVVAVAFMAAVNARAALWTPADTTTAAWYDAADAATVLTNGTSVTNWLDKSGNDRHVFQANSSYQPANGRIIGGLNAIDFGAKPVLQTAALATWLNDTNYHFIAVLQHDASGNYLGTDGPQPLGGGQLLHIGQNSSTQWKHAHFGDDANFSYALDTTPLLAVNSFNNPGSEVFINGISLGTSGGPSSALNTVGVLSIGRPVGIVNTGELGKYKGGIGEVIAVVGDLATSERQLFEGYLAHKWGLEENLPLDHRYRYAAPGAPIHFSDLAASNITTTADLSAMSWSNFLTSATVVWDTMDRGTTNVTDWAGTNTATGSTPGIISGTATNLIPDTTYYYRFYGDNGTTSGWSMATISFATALTPANTPVFLSATSTHNSVSLTWADNAATETEYVLLRSTNEVSYSPLAVLPADSTNYTDWTVAVPRTYYYRLAATNSVDGSGTDPAACQTNGTTALSGDMIFYENFEEPMIDGSVLTMPTGWESVTGNDAGLNDGAVVGKTGDQFGWVFRNGGTLLITNLSHTLGAGTNYTITCDLTFSRTDGDYSTAALLAGTNVLAVTTNAFSSANDLTAQDVFLSFLALPDNPHIGKALGIRLSGDYWHPYFDNLALYATDTSTDTNCPSPTNMVWISLPTSSVSNSITMQATKALDANGVEYFFTNTINGNVSGWQESWIWTDTGLDPGLTYSYKVKARDKSANTNETAWSSEEIAKCEPHIILYESFETPSILPYGEIPFSSPQALLPAAGWYGSSDNYQHIVHDSGSGWPTVTPFGEQHANARGGYIETTSAISNHVLQAEYTYRITYNTGGSHGSTPGGVYCENNAYLFADTNIVASNTVAPSLDDFSETNMLEFIPDISHPHLGEPLKIRLERGTSGSWQNFSIFDNVKVYAIPPDPKGTVLIIR